MTFGQPVVAIYRTPAGEDSYGKQTFTETRKNVTGGFAPSSGKASVGGTAESTVGQDQVVYQPTLFLLGFTLLDLEPIDAFEIAGVRYEISGDREPWQSPFTGWQAGLVVPLRRVSG